MSDLISIIIPSYNQSSYMEETLSSVQNQTFKNWECLIIDDGSTDNTREVAARWTEKDSRFKYYFKKNGGVSSARNVGLNNALGDFIQFLDCDDILKKTKLEVSINAFNSNHLVTNIVLTDFKMLNQGNIVGVPYCNLKKEYFNFESVLFGWNYDFSIPIHCGLFRKEVFEKLRFSVELSAQEDWLLWVKIFRDYGDGYFLNEALVLYRKNVDGRTQSGSYIPDQMAVLKLLKKELNHQLYEKLLFVLIERYLRIIEDRTSALNGIKSTRSYQLGRKLRRAFTRIGIIKYFENLLP
ncbi:glycosyltransferase family 2 protein [Nonlabens ponticola]|uniref:Glycosyltransferase family 2 protein n=1 Tax=Nonlabens ponticola TaxID=2496866 RepID=A0A3S9MXK3_9FLAO|nr:glycosyltransferase family 2 protein [Nonlabens ponticola]AZQ43868.1 glycosyltransferase family 2 protein [Nonlabens ponticola]